MSLSVDDGLAAEASAAGPWGATGHQRLEQCELELARHETTYLASEPESALETGRYIARQSRADHCPTGFHTGHAQVPASGKRGPQNNRVRCTLCPHACPHLLESGLFRIV
jgi:hypothetical protein